jgi:bacteriorhodopsin
MVYEAIAASGSTPFLMAYIATAFLSGLLYLFLRKVWWTDVPLKFPLIHFFIVTWSGIMYLNFLNGTALSDFGWYMDWMISTPLILLALGLTAMHGRETRWDLLGGLMGLQFMLVITGIISQESGMTFAYWIGNALLLGVFYLVWGPLRDMAKETSDSLARSYTTLAGYISVFFVTYPTVWYLSEVIYPSGPGIFGAFETSVAFVVLPFFCKQVYGFLDMYLIHNAGESM